MNLRLSMPCRRCSRSAFTLLEMIVVLAIVALVLGAVHSITQGTLTLADDVTRAQRQDSRQNAFTAFCDRLFFSLPASAAINIQTKGDGGQYLASLELYNVSSPFNGLPGHVVTLYTEASAGGSLQLKLGCRTLEEKETTASVVLFEDISECEWRVYSTAARQWTGVWSEPLEKDAMRIHPPLLELTMTAPGSGSTRRVFWIAPNTTPPAFQAPPAGQPLTPGGQQLTPGGQQLTPPTEQQPAVQLTR